MTGVIAKKAKRVRTLPQEIVRAGVKAAQPPILNSYKVDAGSDLKLSGVPGQWRFKVPTSVRGTGASGIVRGRVRVRPAGPARWLNDGTQPRPQGSGRHPGTPAKRTFDRAEPAAIDAARKAVRRVWKDAMG